MELIKKTTLRQVFKSLILFINRKINRLFNIPKQVKIFRLESGAVITQVKNRNGITTIKVN